MSALVYASCEHDGLTYGHLNSVQEFGDKLKVVKVEADPNPSLVEKYKVLVTGNVVLSPSSCADLLFISTDGGVAGVRSTYPHSFQGWQHGQRQPQGRSHHEASPVEVS